MTKDIQKLRSPPPLLFGLQGYRINFFTFWQLISWFNGTVHFKEFKQFFEYQHLL
jgi:hypothetical protein